MLKLLNWKDSKYGVWIRKRQIEVVIIWVVGHGRGKKKEDMQIKS